MIVLCIKGKENILYNTLVYCPPPLPSTHPPVLKEYSCTLANTSGSRAGDNEYPDEYDPLAGEAATDDDGKNKIGGDTCYDVTVATSKEGYNPFLEDEQKEEKSGGGEERSVGVIIWKPGVD